LKDKGRIPLRAMFVTGKTLATAVSSESCFVENLCESTYTIFEYTYFHGACIVIIIMWWVVVVVNYLLREGWVV